MIRKRLLLLVILFTGVCATAQVPIRELYNRYYQETLYKLADLSSSKSATNDCDLYTQKDYAAETLRFLKSYGPVADSIGLLFYSFTNDSLRTWLCLRKEFIYHQQYITAEQLLAAEQVLRKTLRIDSLVSPRLEKAEGIIIEKEEDNVAGVPLHKAIQDITRILLPGNITAAIPGLSHLLILPEYNIGRIPFYLLQPFGNDAYLIDSCSVSFIPALCNFDELRQQKGYTRGARNFYKGNMPFVTGNPDYSRIYGRRFMPLPGAEREAKKVAGILNTSALTGKAATLTAVKERSANADLLYYATHGLFDMERVLAGSFLVFTPDKNYNTGFWTAQDIQYSYFPNADLAVLSACQTGIGKIYDGGFVGIGRTFYLAGVTNTVTTLWSVDDNSTEQIMTRFMKNILEPDYFYPSRALRKALVDYKKTDPDITHWAPFIAYGISY